MVKIQDKECRKKKMAGGGLHSAAGSINPSVKALTVLVTVLLLAFQYDTVLNLFVLAACLIALLFFSEARLISVVRIMIPASIAAAGMFFMGLYFLRGGSVMQEMGAGGNGHILCGPDCSGKEP